MIDTDDRLALLLNEDTPPARDPAFRIGLLAAIERRRVRNQIVLLSVVCILAGAVLWSLAPAFGFLAAEYGTAIGGFATAIALIWATLIAVRQTVQA